MVSRRLAMANAFMYTVFELLASIFSSTPVDGAVSANPHVSCGSTIKLLHAGHEIRLHSHEVNYGSGSGQQSVTGVKASDDVNSYWVVYGRYQHPCTRGEAIKCGDVIRLRHTKTQHWLHSHHFTSPLSNNQEISCYAGNEGLGDSGDNWLVQCTGGEWMKKKLVQFKHVDTGKHLHASGQTFNRPIAGQYEISACQSCGGIDWKATEGVYFTVKSKKEL
ncbi:stromal cell-derived factor 2-like [Sycon ciliatum]|uniref:stromal cell-derived factor 2-like n=1 Tax=Sycon ciliatum TaxID=27933 RepID=UPI0031F67D37